MSSKKGQRRNRDFIKANLNSRAETVGMKSTQGGEKEELIVS